MSLEKNKSKAFLGNNTLSLRGRGAFINFELNFTKKVFSRSQQNKFQHRKLP